MIDAGENRYGPQEANQSGAKKGGRNAPRLGKSAAGKIKQLAAELLAAGGENQVGTGNLPAENAALRRRVAELTADNRALAAQLRTLQVFGFLFLCVV
jgi:hypothetical protein